MVRYVVVGGGVAGVCCIEELCRLCPNDVVTLVSPDRTLKGISTVARITRNLEELKVEEKDLDSLPYKNFEWIEGVAAGLNTESKDLVLANGSIVRYDKICICAGAQPRRVSNSPRELALRDTQSVHQLCARLPDAHTVMIVGNGGIALELIHALRGYKVIWVMRHRHIGDAFFDIDAAQFLLGELQRSRDSIQSNPILNAPSISAAAAPLAPATVTINGEKQLSTTTTKKKPAVTAHVGHTNRTNVHATSGHAVGPAWASQLPSLPNGSGSVVLENDCEVASIQEPQGDSNDGIEGGSSSKLSSSPATVTLTNGHSYQVDLILAAAGVVPVLHWVPSHIQRSSDGGLTVNRHMQTSVEGVYAAGDSCAINWGTEEENVPWFQMRLWSQARATGVYAAHCMAGVQEEAGSSMAFELFTHVTRFLGQKVVLLGLYNGQGLEHEPHSDMITYSRVTDDDDEHGRTFVRVLLLRGRLQGAVLIGETDLEETFENLILDQLDVGQYGPHLLDPEIELDHVFD